MSTSNSKKTVGAIPPGHLRQSLCAVQPILAAIDEIADHR
jgi:hypothetical protein